MPRVTTVLRKSLKAIQDLDLLKVLQSEIRHEQSYNRFQGNEIGSLGDFVLDWDSPQSQDVVLRKKCDSGEEVAVSALLGLETFHEDSRFPREALMKICIKKPGLSSILQFDCGVISRGDDCSEFDIRNAYYIQSLTCLDSSVYRGPLLSSLDPLLQDELKQYLVASGIGESLTNFLLHHLHKKEQGQYVNWLHILETVVAQSE
uniref:Mitochondrial glycoprotein n=1 Tax=Davidia involucrata TaxID=16924 RepID=A0A5B7BYY1_DAVIN